MGDPIGDRAGEARHIHRGRYSAMAYVVVAFIYEVLFLGATLGLAIGYGVSMAIGAVADKSTAESGMLITAGVVGIAAAWMVFRDRWNCIEAVSSRFCSGLMNLSILYVPVVAFFYANYRGIRKLSRA